MRIKIPLTGTLIKPNHGDPADPVRIIAFDLGDVAWKAVAWDWENDLVEVELGAAPRKVGRFDKNWNPIPDETPAAYQARRTAALSHVQGLLNRPVDQLYQDSGSPRLKNPFKGEKK